MTPETALARTPRRTTATILVIVLAMLISGLAAFLTRESLQPQTAAADTSHKLAHGTHGAGYTIDGQWFGSWRVPEGTGFCFEFDKGHPDSLGGGVVHGNVPGMGPEDSARVKYVANHYGTTHSNLDAAAAAIYVWKIQNTSRFNNYYAGLLKKHKISTTIQHRVSQIAAEAANHGPYTLTMSLGAGLPGQTVSGTVTVRAAAHHQLVPGRAVVITAQSNAVLVHADRTSSSTGQLHFSVKVTGTGTVRVDAKLVSPSSGSVLINRPTPGHQRLVLSFTTTESATATVSSHRSPSGPSVVSTCSGNCGGAAPVTVSVSNPSGAATLREIVLIDGKPLSGGTLDVAGGTTGKKSFTVDDGAVVTTSYCYLNTARACSSAAIANTGSLTVDCPPLPEYRFSATCPCGTDRQITYEVQAPAGSKRSYTVTLSVKDAGGSTSTKSIQLTSGWQALPTATLAKGSTATLSVTVEGRTTVLDSLTEAA